MNRTRAIRMYLETISCSLLYNCGSCCTLMSSYCNYVAIYSYVGPLDVGMGWVLQSGQWWVSRTTLMTGVYLCSMEAGWQWAGVGVAVLGMVLTVCQHGCVMGSWRACKPFSCVHCWYCSRSSADMVKHVQKHTGKGLLIALCVHAGPATAPLSGNTWCATSKTLVLLRPLLVLCVQQHLLSWLLIGS